MVATTIIMALFFGSIAVIVAIANPHYWGNVNMYRNEGGDVITSAVYSALTAAEQGAFTNIGGPALNGIGVLDKISGYYQNPVVYIFKLICQFAVYLAILQLGVRTFVTELSNAFQGISQKLLPGAVPAVDCAVAYGFGSQNAITFGFIAGAVGQIVGTALLIVTGGLGLGVLCITMFVPIFFDNATIGVFANTKLGIKGTFIIPFINGFLQIVLSALLAAMTGITTSVTGGAGAWMAMNDWIIVWPIFAIIIKFIPYVGVFLVLGILIAIPQFQYYFGHKKEDREDYFLIVTDWDSYKAKHIVSPNVETVE
jgi:PTS system ascorbate-specific IIC component